MLEKAGGGGREEGGGNLILAIFVATLSIVKHVIMCLDHPSVRRCAMKSPG